MELSKLEFKREGYFYNMISSYSTAICGLLIYHPNFNNSLDELNHIKQGKLVGIASKEYHALEINIYEKKKHLADGLFNLGNVTDDLSYILMNSAYESVKTLLDQNNPVHEFFRHIRNASSHGGKWSFIGNEPKRSAEWRGYKIENSLNGRKIWEIGIEVGDLTLLLFDIEQSLIK